jgi:indolepyruvate ferredoxin oxidoreductase alpha subunit
MLEQISGATAIALGALKGGVSFVSGYPGAPATQVFIELMGLSRPETVHVEWTSNEKTALEMAYGASLGGLRSMLCVKGVGLNIALDPLMSMNLAGVNAGMVILVGDDPGGWGSQNEQDSRALALALELPLLEPATVPDALLAVRHAYQLSEQMGLPILVRITRALAQAEALVEVKEESALMKVSEPPAFQREYMRWVVLPINVVEYHRRLKERMAKIEDIFDKSSLNKVQGGGPYGIIAAGFTYQKLVDLVPRELLTELRVFKLGTFQPLPRRSLAKFLQKVSSVLVFEETLPLVENATRGFAQELGLTLPLYGRDSGHVEQVGEIFAPHIAAALMKVHPGLNVDASGEFGRHRPSRDPLCEGCPYLPTFDALEDVIDQLGGRSEVVVVGDPGCMVRAQGPPYYLMDVKNSLGSGIGMGAGLSFSFSKHRVRKRVVALCGDSGFLHSGFDGLVDAVRLGVDMLVLILDNGTTALSGFQPHPGIKVDARGRPRPTVDLEGLARETGAHKVSVVDLDRGEDIRVPIEEGMNAKGVAVVIARGKCVLI